MYTRIIALILIITGSVLGISTLFWHQELKYVQPTPIPENYQEVALTTNISIEGITHQYKEKPVFVHFFNPVCPCSRFNLKHFTTLYGTYKQDVQFVAVVPESSLIKDAKELLPSGIPVIGDSNEQIARSCGVYATPQAVLLDKNHQLYYKGNYNKARYCTQKSSNYAQMALADMVAGKPAQEYGLLATQAYGCQLSERGLGINLSF